MFACFTVVSSVINLILLKQPVLLYFVPVRNFGFGNFDFKCEFEFVNFQYRSYLVYFILGD
jgi:hypothetical protein